jgi:hypothetical protein
MKTKTKKSSFATLNWKPRRRGLIYCSSACGSGCTHADYLLAHQEARETIRKLKTKGWKARIWENMGWHWCLVNTLCGMSLHNNGKFWTMINSEKESSHGDNGVNFSRNHSDPNKAVAEQIKLALPYYEHLAQAFENLKRFKQTSS